MSHDLLTQLGAYGTYCDERQGRVSADDVIETVVPLPVPTHPTPLRRGWLVAAAAFVVVLIAGVAIMLVTRGDGEAVPATTPTTLPPATTVVTTQAPTTSTPPDTTTPPATTSLPEPPSSVTSALLAEALTREEVHSFYGSDVKAELEYIAGYVNGMALSPVPPEPRFDTTALGTESVLNEIDRSALASLPSYADNEREPVVEHPFLAGVQLNGTEHAGAFRIDIGFGDADDNVTPKWSLNYTSAYVGEAWPEFGDPTQFNRTAFTQSDTFVDPTLANIILLTGHFTPETPVTIGGLPPNASVVATTFGDGTKVWQRPIAGIAMFADPNKQCLVADSGGVCEAEYTVLNADGTEIMTIVLTPEHGDETRIDMRFRVATP